MAIFTFYETKKKTNAVVYPKPKDVFVNPRGTKDKLQPYLKLDGGLLKPEWAGKTFFWILWEVGSESQLNFKLSDGKCRPEINPSDLDEATELDDDPKQAFVQLDPEPHDHLHYNATWYYDKLGNLTKLQTEHTDHEEHFAWMMVDGKPFPKMITKQSRDFDKPILQQIHLSYGPDGYVQTVTFERPSFSFMFQDGFAFSDAGEGRIFVKSHSRPDLTLVIFPDNTYQFDLSPSRTGKREPLEKIAGNYKHFVTQDFMQKARRLLRNDKDQFDYAEELHPSGMVQTMTWRYNPPATSSRVDVTYLTKGDVLEMHVNGQPWYTINKGATGIEVLHHTGRKLQFPPEKDLREIAVEILLGWHLLFMQTRRFEDISRIKLPNASPTYKPYSHIDYKRYPDGSVKERKVSSVDTKTGLERFQLWTGDDLHWDQYDETPYDEAGNEMELVGQLNTGDVFGSYYLFYSEAEELTTIVFQCT